MTPDVKRCPKCARYLPLDQFGPDRSKYPKRLTYTFVRCNDCNGITPQEDV